MRRLLTVGHGTLDRGGLGALLTGAGVERLIDVRRFPGSRHNPDVSSDAMAEWLPASGVGYRWEVRLGGRRRLGADDDRDADSWWRVDAFRAYAAHTRSLEFVAALDELVGEVEERRTAIMCSETLWWRCHRRLVSDAAVLLRGTEVGHLGHDGRTTTHVPSAGARVTDDGLLRYDRAHPERGGAARSRG